MNQISSVNSDIAFLPSDAGDITTHPPHIYDYRKSDAERGSLGAEVENTTIYRLELLLIRSTIWYEEY